MTVPDCGNFLDNGIVGFDS
ncbi:MAG: hypothetical protein EPN17_11720 [Methylobacter sp.]|nr:MAG: hypothetical protein EPN17_11720 [Methylobacter sp.]